MPRFSVLMRCNFASSALSELSYRIFFETTDFLKEFVKLTLVLNWKMFTKREVNVEKSADPSLEGKFFFNAAKVVSSTIVMTPEIFWLAVSRLQNLSSQVWSDST